MLKISLQYGRMCLYWEVYPSQDDFFTGNEICKIQLKTYPRTNTVTKTGEWFYVQSLHAKGLATTLKSAKRNVMPIFAIPHVNISQLRICDTTLKIGDQYPHRFFMRNNQ